MRASTYNVHLVDLLKALQSTISGSKIVHADLYKIFQDVYATSTSSDEYFIGSTFTKKTIIIRKKR